MATPLIYRWGLALSVAALALAVLLRVQKPLQSSGDVDSQTFCYEGIRTLSEDAESTANCFTVSGGVFTHVFTRDSSTASEPELRPGHVIPGLWDGHGHLLQYGEFLHSVDLFGSSSVEEVRERIGNYLDLHPGAGSRDNWIRGVGWDQMALGTMPTADMLATDARLKDLFIMLDRVDVHCVWVSRSVLDLLPDLPDAIPGGEIVRDPGMGVFCDNAIDLVTALWPRPGPARKRGFVASAMAALHAVGLVGMHDAGVVPEDVALFESMSGADGGTRDEAWTLRVYAMLECRERNTFCAEDAVPIVDRPGDMLSLRGVKLFADGALGSWGSAMLEPYADRPDARGSLLVNASTLAAVTKQWAAAGFQVNIHAIGDLANRLAVDAMEAALLDVCPGETPAECQAPRRFRIEHAQIIHPDDQRRIRAIGIIPSVQPTHATSDMKYAEMRLGAHRTATEGYRMKSLSDVGLVLGSDFPVEPPNPFEGIYAAVTRKNPHTGRGPDDGPDGWHVEEALNLDQALEGFTKGAARGAFLEGRAGVIQEGAFADWVVLDQPLEDVDVEDLRNVKARETWVGGTRVFVRA